MYIERSTMTHSTSRIFYLSALLMIHLTSIHSRARDRIGGHVGISIGVDVDVDFGVAHFVDTWDCSKVLT